MNDTIRQAVKDAIKAEGLSQAKFAADIKYPASHFSRVLSGGRGFVPDVWQRTLDRLGLELVVQPKKR